MWAKNNIAKYIYLRKQIISNIQYPISVIVIAVIFLFSAHITSAQQPVSTDVLFGGDTGQSAESLAAQAGLGVSAPRLIIARVINITLGFLGIIALGLIVYAGFLWMTAEGNEQQIENAKKILIGGVIGLVIILSAFGIAVFVMRAISGATGTTGGGEVCANEGEVQENCNSCGGTQTCTSGFWSACTPLCIDDEDPNADFYITNNDPINDNTRTFIRNSVVTFQFNKTVNSATVIKNTTFKAEYVTYKDDAQTEVDSTAAIDGKPVASGRSIEFSPDSLCPAPNDNRFCFDQTDNDKRVVRVTLVGNNLGSNTTAAIVSMDGKILNCNLSENAAFGYGCQVEFEVNDIIDVENPRIVSFNTDQQVCSETDTSVAVTGEDDAGIRKIDFFVNNETQPRSASLEQPVRQSNGRWQRTGTLDLSLADFPDVSALNVRAVVTDADSNTAEQTQSISLYPAQCCNETQDDNESGIDCGGASGCMACEDLGPVIDWGSPVDDKDNPNGAEGNFITIGGRYFGDYEKGKSKVFFASDYGDSTVEAVLANDKIAGNEACTDVWKLNQIIAIVPSGTSKGPLKVVRADGVSDTTDNAVGQSVPDFQINSTKRPGLCKVNDLQTPPTPSEQTPHQEPLKNITLYGIQLGSSGTFENVKFGVDDLNTQDIIEELNSLSIGSWEAQTITNVGVPILAPQRTTISVIQENERSNSLYLQIDGSSQAPYITNIEPKVGHVGDYITIYGGNFGAGSGINDVVKIGAVNAIADFPSECLQNVWQDNQMIVKVPPTVSGDKNSITVSVGEFTATASDTFRVGDYCKKIPATSCTPTGNECETGDTCVKTALPALCRISPDNGKIGTKVTLYGERFGDTPKNVKFYSNALATPVGADWTDTIINVSVPLQTQSGDVRVIDNSDLQSNPLNFRVGSCLENGQAGSDNSMCGEDSVCCAENTQLPGSCVAKQEDCGTVEGSTYSQYYIEFSTASAGQVSCDGNAATVECNPNVDLCNTLGLGYTCSQTCVCEPPKAPRVIEECDRQNNDCKPYAAGPSPSPWTPNFDTSINRSLSCVNSVITARFDKKMDLSRINSNTITVSKCGADDKGAVNAESCQKIDAASSWALTKFDTSDTTPQSGFRVTPGANLDTNTWYQVKLIGGDNGIKSDATAGGLPIFGNSGADYVWYFKTRASADACKLGCVGVVPNVYSSTKQNELIPYSTIADSEDNACNLINVSGYDFTWKSSDENKAKVDPDESVFNSKENSDNKSYTALAKTIAETTPQAPVIITATETKKGKEGSGKLYITFAPFYVVTPWPSCQSACLNAAVGAEFSVPVKTISLIGNVSLIKCTDAACNSWTNNQLIQVAPHVLRDSSGKKLDLQNSGNLEKNTYYRVIIKNTVTSRDDDKALERLNFNSAKPSATNGFDSYSWVFKTKDSTCEVNRVSLAPQDICVSLIGDTANYGATPFSSPDECSTQGQRLKGADFNWDWTAQSAKVGQFTPNPNVNNDISTHTSQAPAEPAEIVKAVGAGDVSNNKQTADITAKEHATAKSDTAEFCIQCGFNRDDQCIYANGNSATEGYGVGANTCCYPRPQVSGSTPADGASNICRNAMLSVQFDTAMDIASLNKNIIVAANYGADACPDGTNYLLLADAGRNSGFRNLLKVSETLTALTNWLANKIAKLPLVNHLVSITSVQATDYSSRWCAITGTVDGRNELGKGVIHFSPNVLLKAGTQHVILIKGDDNISDGVKKGVVSINGVTLRGKDKTGTVTTYCDGKDNCKFNGNSFYGEAIDFTTLGASALHQGVCVGEHVSIDPAAWTFFSNQNDARDDDSNDETNYDTIDTDNDKAFNATLQSADGQDLASLNDVYSWTWQWSSDDPQLVQATEQTIEKTALVQTKSAVQGKTYVKAAATITSKVTGVANDTKKGQAPVNVFMCKNPWPACDPEHPANWPFKDKDYNFETYYCRDKGSALFNDDLPAISDNGVILGKRFVCSADADNPGVACTADANTCKKDGAVAPQLCAGILKEFLFTRPGKPEAPRLMVYTGPLAGTDCWTGDCNGDGLTDNFDWFFQQLAHDQRPLPQNGTAHLIWNGTPSQEYNIYQNGDLLANVKAGVIPTPDDSTSHKWCGSVFLNNHTIVGCTARITGLENNIAHTFAVTSIKNTAVGNEESAFSNIVSVTPKRTAGPAAPTNLSASVSNNVVVLTWTKSIDGDVSNYKVYLGIDKDEKNEVRDAGNVNNYAWQNLDFKHTYYFAVMAVAGGKESDANNTIRINLGPIGYWKLDEGKSTVIKNSSPFSINGLIIAGASWNETGFLSFNGSNYIRFLTSDYLNLSMPVNGFTQSVWVKPDITFDITQNNAASIYFGVLGHQEKPGAQNRYPSIFVMSNGKLNAGFGTSNDNGKWCNIITNDFLFKKGVWSFVAVNYDRNASQYKVYFDNQFIGAYQPKNVDSQECKNNDPYGINKLEIGRVDDSYFKGQIAEVKIYNYVRTPEQIKADYDSAKSR